MKKKKSLRAEFLAFDDKLARLGVPPLTAWWRAGIGKWLDRYERDHVLELWACVGRGAAKSTALYKLCLFFTLFGDFAVPVGEVHYGIVLSRLVSEAGKGIAIIDRWLTLLGVEHRLANDVIELLHLPRGIRVVAASVAGASGWRAFFVGRDERSKWGFAGAETIDADEVDTSSSAMSASHPFAPQITTGSAWGMAGSFFETITAGSDEGRVVLGPTPTWIAAPHISEESTRRKERNHKRWLREYKCVFSALTSDVFDPEQIDRIFGWDERLRSTRFGGTAKWSPPIAIVDPAGGGEKGVDAYTFAVMRWVLPYESEIPILMFSDLWGLTGKELRKTTVAAVVKSFCAVAKQSGVSLVVGDQRDQTFLTTEIPRHNMQYSSIAWTNELKSAAVEQLQVHMREGTICVADAGNVLNGTKVVPTSHKKLRDELYGFQEKHAPSGALTYAARGGGHDDWVALLLTGIMATMKGFQVRPRLPGSGGGLPPIPAPPRSDLDVIWTPGGTEAIWQYEHEVRH